jgi:hypothetical protein
LYKAVAEGTYGVEGERLHAPDGTCMYVEIRTPRGEGNRRRGRVRCGQRRLKLLRIKITAEVDGVKSDYTITYGRYGTNAALGFAMARADAPGGRETDAKRFAAVRGAEDTPEEQRRRRGRTQQRAPRQLQALRRAYRRHREVAGGDKPPIIHQRNADL